MRNVLTYMGFHGSTWFRFIYNRLLVRGEPATTLQTTLLAGEASSPILHRRNCGAKLPSVYNGTSFICLHDKRHRSVTQRRPGGCAFEAHPSLRRPPNPGYLKKINRGGICEGGESGGSGFGTVSLMHFLLARLVLVILSQSILHKFMRRHLPGERTKNKVRCAFVVVVLPEISSGKGNGSLSGDLSSPLVATWQCSAPARVVDYYVFHGKDRLHVHDS